MVRVMTLGGLLLAVLAACAPARDDLDPEPPYQTKRYKSAQACFDAFAAAGDKKDYKTAYDCLAPESQKDVAAFSVYALLVMKTSLPEEFRKAFKPVYDVMDKHGLTEKALNDAKVEKAEGNALKMPEKTRLALRKLIKKPVPLLLDMAAAQEKVQKDGAFGQVERGQTKTTLKDLKVKGNKATGTIVTSSGGSEIKQSVEFVKLSVGWKMVPSLEFPQPDLPPPPPVEKEVKRREKR